MEIIGDTGDRSKYSRTKRMKKRLLNQRHEICIERAKLITESYKKTEGEHSYIRFSKAFRYILEKMTIFIQEDELIVGNRTSKPLGGPLYPEIRVDWIESDIDTISSREIQPQYISKDELDELKEIIPYWKDKSIRYKYLQSLDEEMRDAVMNMVFITEVQMINGIGHLVLNHEKIITRGLSAIIKEIEKRRDYFRSINEDNKVVFLDSVIISARAVIEFAKRYSKLAYTMAKDEKNDQRRIELEKISQICDWIPENPARSFYEALQSLWFNQLVVQIETGGVAISVGRLDKILYPYYKKDLETGVITRDMAQELIECLFIKMTEINNIILNMGITAGEGPPTAQNLIIGGIDEDLKDITNPLTEIILDAYANIHTFQPNFSIRVSKKSPKEFLTKVAEYIIQGKMMALFNDELIIEAMIEKGFDLKDARNYAIAGCVEPNAPGLTFGSTNSNQFNTPLCLELALKKIKSSDSFQEIIDEFKNEMEYWTNIMVKAMWFMDKIYAENIPSPYISLNIDNCIQNGLDVTQGGAKYNFTGPQLIGLATVADSLATIKKFVFDEKIITLDEIITFMKKNYRGYKEIQEKIINRIPKFGNDDNYVDEIAVMIAEMYADTISKHKNYRGGYFNPGLYSTSFYMAFGSFLNATPDGRKAGRPISNGIGPSNNMVKYGPTEIINSAAKINQKKLANGTVLNLRFNPNAIRPEILASLIRSYFELGGFQIQFNIISSEILKDAQKNPENYRGLLVRIAGYSVPFTELSYQLQNEIISRTELHC
ncbi:MAG: glycyl radical protein [Candidatus Helarchaeota archaeon]